MNTTYATAINQVSYDVNQGSSRINISDGTMLAKATAIFNNNGRFAGVACMVCGAPQIIPNGSCGVCMNCGSTTGCS